MGWTEAASDEDLMLAWRDGDAGAFDVLYTRHKGGVFRYLLRQCGNRGVAEELFQDVWANLIRARAGYTVRAKFTTYIYRVAHNRLIDHYRAHSKASLVSFDEDCPEAEEVPAARADQPEEATERREQVARLLELIGELPDAQREAFLLHEEGGMGVDEIATATGVNRETAKSRLRYALNKLRAGMRAAGHRP
jgi:RNA polymerase sigma-70 factor (ECF subfamily)